MPEKIKIELGPVQRTMMLPLYGAVETLGINPLLNDRKAVEIIQSMDFDFEALGKRMNKLSMSGWISRSLYMDSVIKKFIEENPGATVVNIGCGMDTTFDRVDNGKINWFDLDLPDSIALRRKFIPETAGRKFIASSFLDDGWFAAVRQAGRVLFMSAGVFYYFEGNVIKAFFDRLGAAFPGSELVFDHSSPAGIKSANRMVIKRSGLDKNSYLKWGTKRGELQGFLGDSAEILEIRPVFKGWKRNMGLFWNLAAGVMNTFNLNYFAHIRFL